MVNRLIGCAVLLVLLATPVLGKPINMTVTRSASQGSPSALATDYLKKLIEEKSHGRVVVALEQVEDSALQELRDGKIELGFISLSEAGQILPNTKLLELPFLFRNRVQLYQFLDGPAGQDLLRSEENDNLLALTFWESGFRQLQTNVPLHSFEQLHETRIMEPAEDPGLSLKQVMEVWQRTSASQLQYNGRIGSEVLLSDAAGRPETWTGSLTLSAHRLCGDLLVVERIFWTQLSDELKIIIRSALKDATRYYRELAQQQEQQALKKLETNVPIIRLSEEQRRIWRLELRKTYPALIENMNSELIDLITKG